MPVIICLLMQHISPCYIVSHEQTNSGNFHEFPRRYTDIFVKNVISTEDHAYKGLKTLINNKDAVILRSDKDLSIVIMNRTDYITKMEAMIEEEVKNGTYPETDDTTMQDLKRLQQFLRRSFKEYEHYSEMFPENNDPAKMYVTAKTHKFHSTGNIGLIRLKFHPIINQTETYTYKATKVISRYSKPLCNSEYIIKHTQSFSRLNKELPPLTEDEEGISYDIESLFTNIRIKDTSDYILDQIYVLRKLKSICSELIFKSLLAKFPTEVTFTFNGKFCKQTNN